MKVLVACEESGEVREAFRERGHDAWSCDFRDSAIDGHTYGGISHHIKGDVLPLLREQWDLIIAHPPCTYLCNSGVRWLYEKPGRWEAMRKAAQFFRTILFSGCEKVVAENPIPHRYAVMAIGRKYDQITHPWEHGHGETKATCLWLKGVSRLKPTDIVEGREARIHRMPPGPERSKMRSRTYPGIAKAMAEQWG